jgi:hypothetical protein
MTEQPNWKFTIPEETPTLETHLPNWYQVDVEKLHHQRFEDVAYLFATMVVSKDYEHFDKVKKFLIIPEKPKTLEELQQELDEKFEKLIEKTHLNFRLSHNWMYKLRKYDEFCKRQDADFEYAKEHGQFPEKSKWVLTNANSNSFVSQCFTIKQGPKHEGYYTFGGGYYRFYMPTKPNAITRWFMNKCLSIRWVDDKND